MGIGIKMDVRTAAKKMLDWSKINRDTKVVLFGSNYNMFRKYKEDPHCAKCADSFEIVEPAPVDVFTFEVSLMARRMLAQQGIPSTILIMPSDFMKGADWEQLEELRQSYRLPLSYRELLDRYNVPASCVAFSFESSFRSKSQKILRKMLKHSSSAPAAFNISDDLISARLSAGNYLNIPIGRMVVGREGEFPMPFCQILCSAFYEMLGKIGFTDMLGFFNESEKVCINQGTTIAQKFGYLKMKAELTFFREVGGAFELIGKNSYPQELV